MSHLASFFISGLNILSSNVGRFRLKQKKVHFKPILITRIKTCSTKSNHVNPIFSPYMTRRFVVFSIHQVSQTMILVLKKNQFPYHEKRFGHSSSSYCLFAPCFPRIFFFLTKIFCATSFLTLKTSKMLCPQFTQMYSY